MPDGATMRRWTDTETTKLVRLYLRADDVAAIASALGRSEASVNNRLHYLRRTADPRIAKVGRRARPWTPEEDAALDQLLGEGSSIKACAAQLGRSPGGVEMRARVLSSADRLSSAAGCHPVVTASAKQVAWTPDADVRLEAGWRAGGTLEAVAESLSVSPSSAHYRIKVLRLEGRPVRPRKPRWSEDRLARFAKRREDGATLKQLELEFGISRGTVNYHLRRLRQQASNTG